MDGRAGGVRVGKWETHLLGREGSAGATVGGLSLPSVPDLKGYDHSEMVRGPFVLVQHAVGNFSGRLMEGCSQSGKLFAAVCGHRTRFTMEDRMGRRVERVRFGWERGKVSLVNQLGV